MKLIKFIKKAWRYGIALIKERVLCKFFLLCPKRKRILFESVPDLGDSTYEVFRELLRRNINKEYEFVWCLHKELPELPEIENVKYVHMKKQWWRFKYYEYTSTCLISCNYFLLSHSKKQISYSISHGSPLKSVVTYYHLPDRVDYFFTASEEMGRITQKDMCFEAARSVSLGLPRNDEFSKPETDIAPLFDGEFDKIIVWYPTFRQHNAGGVNTNAKQGIPIIHNSENAARLNECARANRVLIVLKPHFAQDLSYIKDLKLSNIVFIDDLFFKKNHLTSYEFVHATDALVTDYSSIYYDYLLADKPIALVWEDLEEYRQNPGFSVDLEDYCKGAEKVYTIGDFEKFLTDVAAGRDDLKAARAEINARANYASDGRNAKRVVDFICEKSRISTH